MKVTIRNIEEKDKAFVLELNRVNVEVLSPMDEEKFQYFVRVSDMFQVAEVDGKPVAFLIALSEGLPDYTSENYTGPVALVLGSEGKGISPEVMRQCDAFVKIPEFGNINSLNVATAASIILWEMRRGDDL